MSFYRLNEQENLRASPANLIRKGGKSHARASDWNVVFIFIIVVDGEAIVEKKNDTNFREI